jgi:hypothetical protein
MHVFIATNLKKIKKTKADLDDDENIVVRRMKFTSAIKKCINGEIQDAKTVAALLIYAKVLEAKRTRI